MTQIHLLVLCHGLWGSKKNIQALAEEAAARCAPDSTIHYTNEEPVRSRPRAMSKASVNDGHVKLVVLSTSGNEGTHTYDGIDTCAERVCTEIDDEIERLESEGTETVTRFSIVGYSLGGLIARYTIGLLHSRQPSFFTKRRPVNFATIASPAIGMPRYHGFFASFIHFSGSRLLSRSGAQLYARDRFYEGKPLLEIMAEPGSSFYEALIGFERIEVYANALQDRTVPFPTGAMTPHDPFDAARRKSREARKALQIRTDDDEGDPLDLQEGGLEVELDSTYPVIIVSTKEVDPKQPKWNPNSRPKSRFSIKLPPFLRPSFYFFYPVWARYLAVALFPIYFPTLLIVVTITFTIQSAKSRKRIQAMRKQTGLVDRQKRMDRVGLRERMGAAIEDAMVAMDAPSETTTPRQGSPEPKKESSVKVSEDPHDAVLTPGQLRMIEHLNGIAQLRKHFAFFPAARNSHAVIIARDPSQFPAHEEGRAVLRHWADGFRL